MLESFNFALWLHFFIYGLFCRKFLIHTFYCRPESICAQKSALRKVFDFPASACSDGCHVDYLYENQQCCLPCRFFFERNVLCHFSLLKGIPQKKKKNYIDYLQSISSYEFSRPIINFKTVLD